MVLIAVHGTASRFLPAERGTVRLAIEVEHEDRATVMQQVAALHERCIAEAEALVGSGAATWWGSAQVRVRSERRREEVGETLHVVQIASATIQVRFQAFEALSTWVLEVGSVPGIAIERVEWEVARAHRADAERALRIEAVHDAVQRAEAYASAIGGTGVALQAVWEQGLRQASGRSESGWVAQAFGRSTDGGFALRPEDIEIGAAVTADFEVEPAT